MLVRFWMILTVVMIFTTPVIGDEIKIASWNIKDFGPTKAGLNNGDHEANNTIDKIEEIIKEGKFDLVAIQEVEDKDGGNLEKLRELLGDGWDYVHSETTGVEQYAMFFNANKLKPHRLKAEGMMHIYDVDEPERPAGMKRFPGYCSFESKNGSFDFTIITCHNRTWREGAAKDAKYLDDVYKGVQGELGDEDNDILLLGDFNIKGKDAEKYKDHFDELIGKGFRNAICFGEDTMLSANDSTLDNIFYLEGTDLDLVCSDVLEFDKEFGEGYDTRISDHYPVWSTFEIPEVDDD